MRMVMAMVMVMGLRLRFHIIFITGIDSIFGGRFPTTTTARVMHTNLKWSHFAFTIYVAYNWTAIVTCNWANYVASTPASASGTTSAFTPALWYCVTTRDIVACCTFLHVSYSVIATRTRGLS
jgi:hypothetical protein